MEIVNSFLSDNTDYVHALRHAQEIPKIIYAAPAVATNASANKKLPGWAQFIIFAGGAIILYYTLKKLFAFDSPPIEETIKNNA